MNGVTIDQLSNGQWSLYADVKCSNLDCGKEYSWANSGGTGAPCKKCGAILI